MRYEYQLAIVLSPDDGEPILLDRPVVILRLHGADGSERHAALVDTGADHCILPESLASTLEIALLPCLRPPSEGVGGPLDAQCFADVDLELDDFERWKTRAYFAEDSSPEPMILLGYLGFLEFFTATFDGDAGTLDLTPNERLPRISVSNS